LSRTCANGAACIDTTDLNDCCTSAATISPCRSRKRKARGSPTSGWRMPP